MPHPSSPQAPTAVFGPNEWLIDELYDKYRSDPSSVDPAWWDFFADYARSTTGETDDESRPPESSTTESSPTESSHPEPSPKQTLPTPTSAAAAPPAPPAESTPMETSATGVHAAPTTGTSSAISPTDELAPTSPSTPAAPATSTTSLPPATSGAQVTLDTTTVPDTESTAAAPALAHGEESTPVATAVAPTAWYTAAGPAVKRAIPAPAHDTDEAEVLRGPAGRAVANMEASLTVPTATSVREVPAKLLIDNRSLINNELGRQRVGRVSFTHLIGYAVAEALHEMPEMNVTYTEVDGRPGLVHHQEVNLGLAIDVTKPDGTRQLLVPAIHGAGAKPFAEFFASYQDLVRRARAAKLTVADFEGTTATLTNPGGLGTTHSVPRLMSGQGVIIAVGAMEYPAQFQGTAPSELIRLGVSKVLTLTSTYDHRVIQGAQSGEFLALVHAKLLGEDGFYDRVYASLRIPYEPYRWVQDNPASEAIKVSRVVQLIHAYRERGHLMADIDPLAYRQRGHPELDMRTHELTLWDMDREFPTGGFAGHESMNLREVVSLLRGAYCRTIGVEYMHLEDSEQRVWLQERLEREYRKPSRAQQLRILRRLNGAEAFETFLQTKFVGQKRFSLEGAESVIPLLDEVLTQAAEHALHEVGIGMAHRGRLNVLANIAGKSYRQIFAEFEGNDPASVQGSGDVKYHLGTEGVFTAESGATTKVHLAGNPSHLEAVDGVLEGIVRAKQDRLDLGSQGFSVLPILIHGDAAFAGQGVVTEVLNLSQLRGYRTGGTIHIIINNQVGFTTGTASSRSTHYCTDVAKGYQIPIFHVNGDDPEACVQVARLAFDYRQRFARDVVIDMVCYRRRGHNEGDDPSMTQPVMYSLIEAKRSVRKLYTEALIGREDISVEEAEEALQHYQHELEKVFTETRDSHAPRADEPEGSTALEVPESQQEDAGVIVGWRTAVPSWMLSRIGQAYVRLPEGFTPHPKLDALMHKRAEMSESGDIDWGYAEILAFGTLLLEGTPVRLTGQDSRRGTFVQRHAVLHDRKTGAEWTPLQYLSRDQAKFWIYDSSLSEYAVLAFEYGYSVERPDALVAWEAQFGDFANGAQTVMDEFVSSAEQKWNQHSSVVLLLPHGYEGQGPDHSSARIERYLQLAAEDNMVIAHPSTPASYFHLLRRQAYVRPRKPLIVFTPKSMLRLRAAVSPVEAFTSGTFEPVIPDGVTPPAATRRVVLTAGKLYWELLDRRSKLGIEDVAIARLEQYYPLPVDELREMLESYGSDVEVVWAQDEPANQGAWPYLSLVLGDAIGRPVSAASRPSSASPATGSHSAHAAQQEALVTAALT